MLYRITAIAIIVFWSAMMSWLVYHDVWPAWSAQDPPRAWNTEATAEVTDSQVGIFDARGNRLGIAWTHAAAIGSVVSREDLLWINRLAGLPPTRISADSTLGSDGRLEDINVRVEGHPIEITLTGERFAHQFAFHLRAGVRDLRFKIPESQAGMIGQMLRPFTRLGELRVGQSWRMQVFNPFSAVSGFGPPFTPLVVKVTGRERIERDGRDVEVFVVEAPGSRALVSPDGHVYEQEVQLPVGGALTIRDEPFDEAERAAVKRIAFPPLEN